MPTGVYILKIPPVQYFDYVFWILGLLHFFLISISWRGRWKYGVDSLMNRIFVWLWLLSPRKIVTDEISLSAGPFFQNIFLQSEICEEDKIVQLQTSEG
jgi:hypothetical protein